MPKPSIPPGRISSHRDRFVRFAARVAIEKQPADDGPNGRSPKSNPQASIEALIALARVGDKSLQPHIIESLSRLEFTAARAELQLPLLRAWQLAFTRMGQPPSETAARIVERFDPAFPARRSAGQSRAGFAADLSQLAHGRRKNRSVAQRFRAVVITGEELGGERVIARNEGYGKVVQSVGASRPDRQQIAYAYALRNAVDRLDARAAR